MVANKSAPGLKKHLSFNFFLAEKSKLCDIYRRMYDMHREACFIKNIHKWA